MTNTTPIKPSDGNNSMSGLISYVRQILSYVQGISNSLKADMPHASLVQYQVSVTTTAAPLTMQIPGLRSKPVYKISGLVTATSGAAKVFLGDIYNQNYYVAGTVGTVLPDIYVPDRAIDMSDIFVKTDAGTATLSLLVIEPASQANSYSNKQLIA